jgi:hypothetical protein
VNMRYSNIIKKMPTQSSHSKLRQSLKTREFIISKNKVGLLFICDFKCMFRLEVGPREQ